MYECRTYRYVYVCMHVYMFVCINILYIYIYIHHIIKLYTLERRLSGSETSRVPVGGPYAIIL